MLLQGLNFGERLLSLGSRPGLEKLILMQQAPFLHMRQCTFGKLAIQLARHDVHRCLEFTIYCVKMRRAMVTAIHGDDDTKKSTEFRHLADYSAVPSPLRLTTRLSEAGPGSR